MSDAPIEAATSAAPVSKAARPHWQFKLPDALPNAIELRELLHSMALKNLIGPENGEAEEVDEPHVYEHYLSGIVAPRNRKFSPNEADDLGDNESSPDDGPIEPAQPSVMTMFPSSIGLTFTLPHEIEKLEVTAHFGHYTRGESATGFLNRSGEPKPVWQRRGVETTQNIEICEGELKGFAPDAELPEVRVRGRARKRAHQWIVTLFLVNNQTEPKQESDRAWLFQAGLRVRDAQGKAIFRQHNAALETRATDIEARRERRQLAMLYRRCVEFAAGHNTGVHVERDSADTTRASSLQTVPIPRAEVLRQDPPATADIAGVEDEHLSMNWLASAPRPEVLKALRALEAAYADWIAARELEVSDPTQGLENYEDVARDNLERCGDARARIAQGIAVLERDDNAWQAFRFANTTMALQRVRTMFTEKRRRDPKAKLATYDKVENRRWRPFQLAFILINLPSLCDLEHEDRVGKTMARADLLWFPTGGGKTEAYLGLTAFTLAIRRLQGQVEGRDGKYGVAVLMRYTLRLLTLQQFQRAAALICACELERRANPRKWGDEPFRLGLWVGAKTTPNSTSASEDSIKAARMGDNRGGGGTPAQLTNCPWCGDELTLDKNFVVKGDIGRTLINCDNFTDGCEFTAARSGGEGIPAVVVDEEVYRLLPSLLISTVDKFAQMPWNGRTAMLFGRVTGRCPRHGFVSPEIDDAPSHAAKGQLAAVKTQSCGPLRPPDLIIQDELHLISGPLGTMVGLYETAVDALCSWKVNGKEVRPKVVASTATIRNARAQMNALFLRQVEVFPPPALDADDNFFSRKRPSDSNAPGRLYVGVCAPGKRLKVALIRVYAAYMAAAQVLRDRYGALADPYLTTVGYFNSMRELGGMKRLVDDDVKSRLRRMDARGFGVRHLNTVVELTSRRSAVDIPQILDQLGTTFEDKPDPKYVKVARTTKTYAPIDVLLATNMISVGVDVPRLGLMMVAGQPKSSSEYIQATSRVGRSKPGLVCTVFNWTRPRDLSHYEHFEHYHSTFYQHVEALSVTPFAPRAQDRGLTALLVALIRLEDASFNANARAQDVTKAHAVVQNAVDLIAARAESVTDSAAIGDSVRAELVRRLDEWSHRSLQAVSSGAPLAYKRAKGGAQQPLLEMAGLGKWDHWTCLNSLRDVEPMCNLVWKDGGLDE